MRATRMVAAVLSAAVVAPGCGDDDKRAGSPDPATERSDPPAKPPPGWRTFTNRPAGFTVSVPLDWAARRRGSATLIRSSDRLLAVTIAADRSEPGRTTRPEVYARKAFRALPNFRRLRAARTRRVSGSPYPSARIDGRGTLAGRRQRQRITVAAFRRPRRVTYTVVAFSAERGGAATHAAGLRLLLRSLRARRPAF